MKAKQNIFFLIVLGFGTAVLIDSTVQILYRMPESSLLVPTLVKGSVMLILFGLCRSLPVFISEDKTIDVSFVPVVASVMIYGPFPTLFIYFLSSFLVFAYNEVTGKYEWLLLQGPRKELFNLANIMISIFVGCQVLFLLGGYGEDFSIPYSLVPATLFSILTISANLFIFILYFVFEHNERFFSMLSQTIIGLLPNIISTIPFGIFLALLLDRQYGSYIVLLFIMPLLLARYSFKLYLDSQSLYMRTIASLSRAIEAKDIYTKGHSERVADFSEKLCIAMRLPKKITSEIKVAALLHDIGKIGIEDHILNKPGALTNEEYEEIKTHPGIGRRIIEDVKLSSVINDAVLYHHCYYNGSGYPGGEDKPAQLPIAAAIIGAADAFDAMTSSRPYREKMSYDVAYRILQENSGGQFHPEVVLAFGKILETQKENNI